MSKSNDNPDIIFGEIYDKYCHSALEVALNVLNDEHLPGKARINGVLGQFDKFYEVYDIDESSPYYVPKDNRIKMFWE